MDKKELLKRWALAYTEPSLFYVPWRKRKLYIKYCVKIYFKIKTGVDSEGNPTYRNLSNIEKASTIMGIFDPDGTLIYCSAYRRNGVLRNNYSHQVSLSLAPGTYTIQCLQYGIGVGCGPSDNIMSFTVPDPKDYDRTADANNNYGYINSPSISFEYIMGMSGLLFDIDVQLESVGKVYWDTNRLKTCSCTWNPPSYGEAKAAYEAKAAEIGHPEWEFNEQKYMQCIFGQIGSGYGGYTVQSYAHCDSSLYYSWPIMHISFMEGDNTTPIQDIDFSGYNNQGTQFAQYFACIKNGVAYNSETQHKYEIANESINYANYLSNSTALLNNSSGAWTMYYIDDVPGIFNRADPEVIATVGDERTEARAICQSSRIPRLHSPQLENTNIRTNYYIDYAPTIYDSSGSGQSYATGKHLGFKLSWNISGSRRVVGTESFLGDTAEDGTTFAQLMAQKMSNASSASAKAWEKYQSVTDDRAGSQGCSFYYPIAALFGHIPKGTLMSRHFNPPPSSYKYCEGVYYSQNSDVGVKWTPRYEPTTETIVDENNYYYFSLDNYMTDLSEYDPDGNYNDSKYWIDLSKEDEYSNALYFMRQNIIDVNTAAIP